jgi:hypothetical protein
VLRETDPQAGLTLWEVLLPEEVKRLPAELARSTPTWTTAALHPRGFGGGGLEWPQEGVIDQVQVAAGGRDRDGRVVGPVACYGGGVDWGRPGEALVGGGLHQGLLVVEPVAGVGPGQHQPPRGWMACASTPPGQASAARMPEWSHRGCDSGVKTLPGNDLVLGDDSPRRSPIAAGRTMSIRLRADGRGVLARLARRSAARVVTSGPLPWPMTWPMFCLAQACSRLTDTLSDLRYLNQPTRTFRLPVDS